MTPQEIAAYITGIRAQQGCDPEKCPNSKCPYFTLCHKGIGTSLAGNVVSLPALVDANAADRETMADFGSR
jgi:hypothetical protein